MTANNTGMDNRIETPPVRDAALPDKILSTNKLVQVYFSQLAYRNEHPEGQKLPEEELVKLLMKWSDGFQQWYTSKEGQTTIRGYAEQHTQDEIDLMKDMGELVQSFLQFHNRQPK